MDNPISYLHYKIIKKQYPNVSFEDIKNFQGNDNFVFVVNNDIAFRFPKVPRKINPARAEFLKAFVQSSPLPLPTIDIHVEPGTGLNYEINTFIPGESFFPKVAKTFTKEELMVIAQKLGEFLSAVHSFPAEKARRIGVDEMDPSDFWAYMEQNENAYPKFKRLVFPHISKDEQKWVEKLFTDYISLIKKTPFKTRVVHSDMWVFHIIVDPQKHTLSGVIDFGPRIADPANDFKAFEYYGADFVQEVYKSYKVEVDEHFEKRRLFYTGHDEVFELARQIEKKDNDGISGQKVSLSSYIKQHS